MSIRVGAICGNHPRNLYLVNTLANEFELAGIVLQNREELMPTNTYFNCDSTCDFVFSILGILA